MLSQTESVSDQVDTQGYPRCVDSGWGHHEEFETARKDVFRKTLTVLQGYYRNFMVPYNLDALNQFRYVVGRTWLRTLRRRSQKARRHLTWEKFKLIQEQWLPIPQNIHPWPNVRFRRRYPRQEPDAVMPHVRICTGGAP